MNVIAQLYQKFYYFRDENRTELCKQELDIAAYEAEKELCLTGERLTDLDIRAIESVPYPRGKKDLHNILNLLHGQSKEHFAQAVKFMLIIKDQFKKTPQATSEVLAKHGDALTSEVSSYPSIQNPDYNT